MAASVNENSSLMDEFEEAFKVCLLSLTKPEPNTGTSKEEIEAEVQETVTNFIDVARQMEAFFLQKRFLVSTLKPDMLIKDENQDLRIEIQRKDALLNKHYNRLEEWKACLSDMQQAQSTHRPVQQMDMPPGLVGRAGNMPPGAMPMAPSQQQQQQQHMQSQLQQQKMLQAQQQQMQQMRMMGKMPK